MADEELPPSDRRATWAAMRTFRQRPTVVGRTQKGETIYVTTDPHQVHVFDTTTGERLSD